MVAFAAAGSAVDAQELEPRAYGNTPTGLNFLIVGYGYSHGDVVTDPSVPLKNANVEVHSTVLAYVRPLDVWGRSGKLEIVLPYAWASGTAEFLGQPQERQVSGLGDPMLLFSVNLYGAPALAPKEFAGYEQDLIIGASLQLSAPLGQYDSDKLLNIGTNRWSVKPELGLTQAWGPWTLELAAGITFYTDNDDFLSGMTREQDPLHSVQGHIIYSFRSGIWVALDATYYTGGRATVDGVKDRDLQENWRLGTTVALPVNRRNSIKLYASTGIYARSGGNFDAVGIAWQHRWGGGL